MAFGCHKPCCCLGNERSWEEAGKLPIPEPALSRHPPQRGSLLLLTPQLLQGALGGGTGGSLVPPNATAGGSVPPVHPLALLLPVAAKENLFHECKRRSKCCVPRVGAFNANLGGRWDVRSAHPVPGSQSHDRSRSLHRCGSLRGLTPGPEQWSGARLCHRAAITGTFLTTPVYPAPGVWGSPEAMLWGCSRGPVPFAAATPRVFFHPPRALGTKGAPFLGGEAAPALSQLAPHNSSRETGASRAAVPKGGGPFPRSLRPQKPEQQPLPSWGLRTVLGPLRTKPPTGLTGAGKPPGPLCFVGPDLSSRRGLAGTSQRFRDAASLRFSRDGVEISSPPFGCKQDLRASPHISGSCAGWLGLQTGMARAEGGIPHCYLWKGLKCSRLRRPQLGAR